MAQETQERQQRQGKPQGAQGAQARQQPKTPPRAPRCGWGGIRGSLPVLAPLAALLQRHRRIPTATTRAVAVIPPPGNRRYCRGRCRRGCHSEPPGGSRNGNHAQTGVRNPVFALGPTGPGMLFRLPSFVVPACSELPLQRAFVVPPSSGPLSCGTAPQRRAANPGQERHAPATAQDHGTRQHKIGLGPVDNSTASSR
jgi:hypothetical protein